MMNQSTHRDDGGSVTGVMLCLMARKTHRRTLKTPVTEHPVVYVCIAKNMIDRFCNRIIFLLKKCTVCIETMDTTMRHMTFFEKRQEKNKCSWLKIGKI